MANSAPTHDFEGRASGPVYTYDQRGNLLADDLKALSRICYNRLNQPEHLQWANGNSMRFRYTTSGRRFHKLTQGTDVDHPAQAAQSTDVDTGCAYPDGVLESIALPEGRLLYAAPDPRSLRRSIATLGAKAQSAVGAAGASTRRG